MLSIVSMGLACSYILEPANSAEYAGHNMEKRSLSGGQNLGSMNSPMPMDNVIVESNQIGGAMSWEKCNGYGIVRVFDFKFYFYLYLEGSASTGVCELR